MAAASSSTSRQAASSAGPSAGPTSPRSGWPRPRTRALPAGRPRRTHASSRPSSTGSRRSAPDVVLLNAAAALRRRGPDRRPRAPVWPLAASTIDDGRAAASWPASAPSGSPPTRPARLPRRPQCRPEGRRRDRGGATTAGRGAAARRRAASSARSPPGARPTSGRELAGRARRERSRAAPRRPPPPRPFAERLARPGLHLIAEVKRRSPSAGAIAAAGDDVAVAGPGLRSAAARPRSRVLCEPHWFGGSIDDLRGRPGGGLRPGPGQGVRRRPAPAAAAPRGRRRRGPPARRPPPGPPPGAPRGRCARPRPRAARRGARRARARPGARHPGPRHRHQQPRPAHARRRPRTRRPSPRLDPGRPARDRRVGRPRARRPSPAGAPLGFDGALVGEALMRSADPAAAARAFVAAGAFPDDPAVAGRLPFVKICGIDGRGRHPGRRPRRRRRDRAQPRRRDAARAVARRGGRARRRSPGRAAGRRRRPAIVADHRRRRGGRGSPGSSRPSTRTSSSSAATSRRPRRRVARPDLEGAPPAGGRRTRRRGDRAAAAGRRSLPAPTSPPGVERLLLDTAGGPHPGGTGRRARRRPRRGRRPRAAGHPRPAASTRRTSARRSCADPGRRRRRRVGRRGRRGSPAQRPRKDPLRVALFVKRARAARVDRPTSPSRPTPVDPGLLEADAAGRWGIGREFGGRYVPETLMAALEGLERAYAEIRRRSALLGRVPRAARAPTAGRPTPIYRADRLAAEALATRARCRGRRRRARPSRPPCASTSSARISPTPARTRSTTRSARRS